MPRYINSEYGETTTQILIHNFNEIVSNNMAITNNFFEIKFLDYIAKNYKNQKGILDIGANIGNHSLFFAKFLNCEMVYSFEPFPTNIVLLKENLVNFRHKSKIYEIALSNKEGTLPLYNSQADNFGGFSLHSYSNGTSFIINPSVNVITLDSLNLDNISMIKIDVENHENEVLEGAKQTILRNKPIIFIENLFHGFPNVCPDPNPHKKIFNELNYVKKESNILGSYMDLWIPNYSV
jgi:FkbM family methyltransferase